MSRRVLAILFLLTAGLRAETGTAPQAAFAMPDAATIENNPDFWSGYMAGEVVPILVPDANYPDWWSYIAAVRTTEMPRTRLFFPINYNVGFDSAEETAANYLWRTAPTSCGVMVCGATATARVRKSMAPKQATHPDLIGKGVKGITKLGYKGARIIL